ncbi:MAG: glycosyltransferase family 2 protein [Fimbriimonadaceae bacterium]
MAAIAMPPNARVFAVIPTFNEEQELAACLASLRAQTDVEIIPLVINAGKPLSPELAAQCDETMVDGTCFWTCCTQTGFDIARQRGAEIVMMVNSDVEVLPGTVALLVQHLQKQPLDVFASPGYTPDASGRLRLQFSHDRVVPFLMHNYLVRAWQYREDAPAGVFEGGVAGGQGVLFSASYLERVRLDPKNFPQARGDHVFWAAMRRAGAKLYFVCQAGIVNQRPLSEGVLPKGFSLKGVWRYMTSEYAPESVPIMWRYRRATLPLAAAVPSFILMVPGAWTYRLIRGVVRGVRGIGRRAA